MFQHFMGFIVGIASSVAAAALIAWIANRFVLRFSFRRVLRDILKLRALLAASDYNPDLLVGIDRSGSIVASILAGHLGLRSILSAHTQTTYMDGTRQVILSEAHNPPIGSLQGKSILVVGCFIDTGRTAEVVYEYYRSRLDRPEVRLAVLYTSPAPILKPKYYVSIVGKDIKAPITTVMRKMPWMSKEWRYSFPDERGK